METAKAGAVSLGGSVVASHHKWGHGILDTHDAPLFAVGAFFFGEADFLFYFILPKPPFRPPPNLTKSSSRYQK